MHRYNCLKHLSNSFHVKIANAAFQNSLGNSRECSLFKLNQTIGFLLKKKHLLLLTVIVVAIGLFAFNFKSKPPIPNEKPPSLAVLNEAIPDETLTSKQKQPTLPTEPVKNEQPSTNKPKPVREIISIDNNEHPLPAQNNPLPPAGEETQSTTIISDLWEDIEPDTLFGDFPPEKNVKPIKAIRLSEADLIGTLKEGDLVKLPIIEGEEYTATITESKNFANGSSSVTGSYELNGEKHTVTLTQGVKTSFGTFSTPNGTYQISLLGDKGYIYSSDDLDAQRIDTNKPDTLIPPEE